MNCAPHSPPALRGKCSFYFFNQKYHLMANIAILALFFAPRLFVVCPLIATKWSKRNRNKYTRWLKVKNRKIKLFMPLFNCWSIYTRPSIRWHSSIQKQRIPAISYDFSSVKHSVGLTATQPHLDCFDSLVRRLFFPFYYIIHEHAAHAQTNLLFQLKWWFFFPKTKSWLLASI